MSFSKIPVSMLTASLVALSVACAGPSRPAEPLSHEALPSEALPSEALPSEALQAEPGHSPASIPSSQASAQTPSASVAETFPTAPANEPAARKNPMQALNQLVTAQALLVSLLLAPLSKDAAEQPLASVDSPRASPSIP